MGWRPLGSNLPPSPHWRLLKVSLCCLFPIRTLVTGLGPTWIIQDALFNPRHLIIFTKTYFFFPQIRSQSLVLELRTWPSVYGQGDHHSAHYPFLIPPPTLSFQSHWPRSCASTCLTHFHPRAFAHAVPSAWVSLTLYRRMQICLILSWGLHNFSS